MAQITINQDALTRLLNGPIVQADLERRAGNVLQRAQTLVPKDTGDFGRSLEISSEVEFNKGRRVVRIISNDPQANAIIHGTSGPYRNVPPFGGGSQLGGWATRHSFVSNKSKFFLSKAIAAHGTPPAGTHTGRAEWIQEATKEASR